MSENPNNFVSSDFLRVLLALKANIMRDLKVATVGVVKSIDLTEKTCVVEPFPLTENEMPKNIKCFLSKSCIDAQEGSIVVILFLDRNSNQTIKQSIKNIPKTFLKENKILHDENYGIAITILKD